MKPINKEAAKALAFMNNKTYFTAYSHDILSGMFEAEVGNVKILKRSDQLEIRPMLVQLMKKYASHQEYSLSTLFLGIYILDVYMDNYILSDFIEHQRLIALVALLLAAKSEDIDELVPSIKDLLKIVDLSDDLEVDFRFKTELDPIEAMLAHKKFADMYCKLEYLIFESMEFNTALRPTVVTFLGIFQNVVVTRADLTEIEEKVTFGDLRVTANEYLREFTDVIISDIDFFNIRPSELAAAVVASTRKLLKIKNYWNDQLTTFTRYEIEDIRPLILVLIEKRNNHECSEDSTPIHDIPMRDSGYLSASETEDEETKQVNKKRKLNNRVGITYGVI